jgi:hypothetical protein
MYPKVDEPSKVAPPDKKYQRKAVTMKTWTKHPDTKLVENIVNTYSL